MTGRVFPAKLKPLIMNLNLWALSGELGLLIALPLVVFVLVGIKLDRWLGTLPLFIIVGMVLAGMVSTIAVARKIKRVTSHG